MKTNQKTKSNKSSIISLLSLLLLMRYNHIFKQQNSTNPTEMQAISGAPKIARQFLRVLIGG
jgi:hypothetical protein